MQLSNLKLTKADFKTSTRTRDDDLCGTLFDDAISNGHWALKLATLTSVLCTQLRSPDVDNDAGVSAFDFTIRRRHLKTTWDSFSLATPAPTWIITPYLYDDAHIGYGLIRLLESEDTGTLAGIQDRYLKIIQAKIGEVLYSHEHKAFHNAPMLADSVAMFMSYRTDNMRPFPKKHRLKKAEAQVEAAESV